MDPPGPGLRFDLATGEARAVRDDVVELLVRLIRADTSNPPGDVSPAAAVLADYFAENGLELTVVGETPSLPNCAARLRGSGSGPSLLLLGHLDVVPADDAAWTVPPFDGVLRDGYVWGRGALDMKNQVAAQAAAFVRLARAARAGTRLRGDLLFAATADEETGQHCGARWLAEHEPGLVRADFVVNEGGIDTFDAGDRRLYTVNTGEKGYVNCRITLHGRPAHGSVPLRHDNVVQGLAAVIESLAVYEPQVHQDFLPHAFIGAAVKDPALRRRLADPASAEAAVRELAFYDPAAAAVIEPLLGMTLVVTRAATSGDAVNVVPSRAEVSIDCRVLPGQTPDDVRREINKALSGIEVAWQLEVLDFVPGNASPASSPLLDAIAATIVELRPRSDVTCMLFSGFTDCVHIRRAFPNAVAYGFCPFVVEGGAQTRPRVHGVDERIAVDDLVFQTVFTERLARRLLR
jgi:acetylornithine deacetylase/succinyl-diaminopimelate desuccinylase-like protein